MCPTPGPASPLFAVRGARPCHPPVWGRPHTLLHGPAPSQRQQTPPPPSVAAGPGGIGCRTPHMPPPPAAPGGRPEESNASARLRPTHLAPATGCVGDTGGTRKAQSMESDGGCSTMATCIACGRYVALCSQVLSRIAWAHKQWGRAAQDSSWWSCARGLHTPTSMAEQHHGGAACCCWCAGAWVAAGSGGTCSRTCTDMRPLLILLLLLLLLEVAVCLGSFRRLRRHWDVNVHHLTWPRCIGDTPGHTHPCCCCC